MAWLQKQGNIWWIGWRLNGKQFRESTKETDKAAAQKHLDKLNALDTARKFNALTEDFFKAATGRIVEKPTASKFLADWLAESQSVTTKGTMLKYRQVVREFGEHIGAEKNGLLMEDIGVEKVSGFFAEKRKTLAPGTVKGYRRILSSIFLLAQNRGQIKANPVALAKDRGRAPTDTTTKKRPFTLAELKTLFDKATPFWRYMLVAGYSTGQSLGDLVTLRAANVDRAGGLLTLNRRKTGKQVIIHLRKPLLTLLVSIWPKDGKGFFWPEQAARYERVGASPFSQEFYELLAGNGLVRVRDDDKKSSGKGRNVKREAQKLGFHNVRHTFVTHLKIGGAMDSVARELAGHSSNAVSAVYTHLPAETLAKAINQLPEFVK